MHLYFYPTLAVFTLTHVFFIPQRSHRLCCSRLRWIWAVHFHRDRLRNILRHFLWAGGPRRRVQRWLTRKQKPKHQVNSCWASSKKENGLFSIVENACLFAFLSSITKFKRTEQKKKKPLITFKLILYQFQNLRELKEFVTTFSKQTNSTEKLLFLFVVIVIVLVDSQLWQVAPVYPVPEQSQKNVFQDWEHSPSCSQ